MQSNKPWLLVRNPEYFRCVLVSMVTFDPTAVYDDRFVVRFGLGGEGTQPNYQLESPGDHVVAYNGGNHQPNTLAPGGRYNDHQISQQRFTLHDVQKLLDRCLGIQSGKIDPGPTGEGP